MASSLVKDSDDDLFSSDATPAPGRPVSLSEAYAYCQKIARSHYENFPVASIAVPKKLRPHIAAVYAFARTADDFADEKEYENVRMARLKSWELRLETMLEKEADHPIFLALAETTRQFKIPIQLFADLLTAFKMDVVMNRHDTFEDVLHYCRHSANPVGRIILHIYGQAYEHNLEQSDAICTALQLANFWQDVGVDLEKNRIYFPKEDMERAQYSEEDLFKKVVDERFRKLMAFQVERTWKLFEQGKSLCARVPGRLGLELRMTWLGGTQILKKIEKVQGNVFQHRPVLNKKDVLGMLLGSLWKKGFSL